MESSNNHHKFTNIIKSVFLTVWTLVGLTLLVLVAIAQFGSEGTWTENLNLTKVAQEPTTQQETQQTPQQQPQQQQPAQPTQEQLDCVEQEVGEERFAELQQGGQAESEEEALAIQQCLQS